MANNMFRLSKKLTVPQIRKERMRLAERREERGRRRRKDLLIWEPE